MDIIFSDLEGVFVPEIWINVAEKTGIEELKLTTRDIPDYDELMQKRLSVMETNGLKLKDVTDVIAGMAPLEGALECLDWIRERAQIIILSDTFEEFARPLMQQLKFPALLCHSLEIDTGGRIADYRLRMPDQKKQAVLAFKALNYRTIAFGDSYNDTGMLTSADHGFFFCPPDNVAAEFSQLPITRNYKEVRQMLSGLMAD